MAASRSDLTLVCYVRAPLLLDPIDSKVRTLRRCEREGPIDDLVTRSWPDRVALDGDGPHGEVVERFREFERWADDHGVSVRPPFRVTTSTSLVDDDGRRVLVTPLLCLALYHDSRLLGVYPHADEDGTYTATDAIAALRSGDLPPLPASVPAPEETEIGASGPEADADTDSGESPPEIAEASATSDHATPPASPECPDCERTLVNVQGLLSCPDCRWSDAELDAVSSSSAKLVYLSLVGGPVPIEALESALDLDKLTIYGLLGSLSDRGLVEQTEAGYRAVRSEAAPEEEQALAAENGE